MAISDTLLNGIQLLQSGKEEGFNIIYSETSSYVFARTRMIMKEEADAYDLMQDTYIQAYQNINSLQDPQNIFAWLGAIAYRQGMKIYRKKNEILLDENGEGIFEEIESNDIEGNPELSVEQKAVGNIIAEIIDELPPLQKSALTAFYYDGMKITEIAEMCDCSTNTIKSRLNYAKKYVKEKVELREKQDNITLHSSSIAALILLGLTQLLSSEKYILSANTSAQIFSSICSRINLPYNANSPSADADVHRFENNGSDTIGNNNANNIHHPNSAGVNSMAGAKNATSAGISKISASAGMSKIAMIIGGIAIASITAIGIGVGAYSYGLSKGHSSQNDLVTSAPASGAGALSSTEAYPDADSAETATSPTDIADNDSESAGTENTENTENADTEGTAHIDFTNYEGVYYEKGYKYKSFIKPANKKRLAAKITVSDNHLSITLCGLFSNKKGTLKTIYVDGLDGEISAKGNVSLGNGFLSLNDDGTITISYNKKKYSLSDRILVRLGGLDMKFPDKKIRLDIQDQKNSDPKASDSKSSGSESSGSKPSDSKSSDSKASDSKKDTSNNSPSQSQPAKNEPAKDDNPFSLDSTDFTGADVE